MMIMMMCFCETKGEEWESLQLESIILSLVPCVSVFLLPFTPTMMGLKGSTKKRKRRQRRFWSSSDFLSLNVILWTWCKRSHPVSSRVVICLNFRNVLLMFVNVFSLLTSSCLSFYRASLPDWRPLSLFSPFLESQCSVFSVSPLF